MKCVLVIISFNLNPNQIVDFAGIQQNCKQKEIDKSISPYLL